jgi:hypothetical protein
MEPIEMSYQFEQAIQSIDLSPIKFKLIDREDGEGWSLEKANRVAELYLEFLKLVHIHGHEQTLVPCRDVDVFWHYHILDTRKYFVDCDALFGFYLHHYPYLGMRDKEDEVRLRECFERTINLMPQGMGSVDHLGAEASICGARCGGSIRESPEWRPSDLDCRKAAHSN